MNNFTPDFPHDDFDDWENPFNDNYIIALRFCVESNNCSVLFLKPLLLIDFISIIRIIDWMENMGYVSPPDKFYKRRVLLSKEEFEKIYGFL